MLQNVGNNLIPASINPCEEPLNDTGYCAHAGPSMNPTLCNKDFLEVEPYGQKAIIVGDVVLFRKGNNLIVHRVIGVTQDGVRTRGDNNNKDDPGYLTSQEVVGRVVAAWQGNRRRKIFGGLAGRIFVFSIRIWRGACRCISSASTLVYYFIDRKGSLKWFIFPYFRPMIVMFSSRSQRNIKLMIGSRVVGYYDQRIGRWSIRWPFYILIDEAALPKVEDII